MSKFYPEKVDQRFTTPKNVGVAEFANANGKWADFLCGVSVRFLLRINEETRVIEEAKFKTNACGYVIATADFICERIKGHGLTELHGLEDLEQAFADEFREFPSDRKHCSDICFDAMQNALAEFRIAKIEEWTGEKALICTCFGVSEELIENAVSENNIQTIEDLGEQCNAGTGCGSCQPLIQEILDSQHFG